MNTLQPREIISIVLLVVQPKSDRKFGTESVFYLQTLSLWFLLVLFSGILLFLLRRRNLVDLSSFSTSMFNTYVTFFGGGNVVLKYPLEKCFLLAMTFVTMYLNAHFGGNLFDLFTRDNQEGILTYEQLRTANLTIYAEDMYQHLELDALTQFLE